MRKMRSEGLPSGAFQSTPAGTVMATSPALDTAAVLACGMADALAHRGGELSLTVEYRLAVLRAIVHRAACNLQIDELVDGLCLRSSADSQLHPRLSSTTR